MILKTKVVVVAIYLGQLPVNTQLWLDSCEWNPDFNWLLLTDMDTSGYAIPSNVLVRCASLEELRSIFSEHVGFPVALDRPYKLCDFRPLYWTILRKFGIECDFWGFCDLDVVFGRLSRFLTDDHFAKHDRLLGLGHLSLLRNSRIGNQSYRFSGSTQWRAVFSTPENFGYDEHSGINRVWETPPMRFYRNESIVADIAPEFAGLRLTFPPSNRLFQRFYVEQGGVFCEWWNSTSGWTRTEFAYIHFQKRRLAVVTARATEVERLYFHADKICLRRPPSVATLLADRLVDTGQIAVSWARLFKRRARAVLPGPR